MLNVPGSARNVGMHVHGRLHLAEQDAPSEVEWNAWQIAAVPRPSNNAQSHNAASGVVAVVAAAAASAVAAEATILSVVTLAAGPRERQVKTSPSKEALLSVSAAPPCTRNQDLPVHHALGAMP